MRKKVILGMVGLLAVAVLLAIYAGVPEAVQNNPTKFKGNNGQQGTNAASISSDTGYIITRAVITNDDSTQVLVIQPAGTAVYNGTPGAGTGFVLKPGESLAFDCNVKYISLDSDGTCDYRYFFSEQVQ
jgi:hypothetical protein